MVDNQDGGLVGWFAILDEKGGLAEQVQCDDHPSRCGYDLPASRIVALKAKGDPGIHDLAPDGTWKVNLARLRDRVIAGVDAERARRVTPEPGKALAHLRKGSEATRYFADPAPPTLSSSDATSHYPWLVAEATARSMTLADVASEVRSAMLANEERARTNEARAIAAKAKVRAAQTESTILAAGDVTWS